MDTKNRPFDEGQTSSSTQENKDASNNPFENNQSLEKDIAQSKEELENEQQFKQAQTERD